ncbi:hypothetical protein [Bradyrhizobium sp. BRP56]|uniref:hypothetical protein n=1 Tax=Bradyrhizobium sp. BRP56 TaxID=2793819 RepID=UPI001CD393F1|nr:hypothetical protein [Bradyrhizobium sp. BRP56]MCA1399512.1 hypothetical protein [Bradyrhizobium sp. BRP56]
MSDTDWVKGIPSTMTAISAAHFALLEANMALPERGIEQAGYHDRIRLIDAAVLELTAGKWLYNRATGECADYAARTSSADDLAAARRHLREAERLADASHRPTPAAIAEAAARAGHLSSEGREILHYQGVPVVPSICPIVILRGSSRQMGAQYVEQCVQIFGPFVFEHLRRRPIAGETERVIRSWEEQMRRHTPELLEMAKGMSEAARRLGIVLSYEHALSMWTDLLPPATEPMAMGVLDAEGGDRFAGYLARRFVPAGDIFEAGTCSGAAAWGAATQSGRSCFASSTDHDYTFQVTIVAYPDDGHPFVYTPFSVNGSIPGLGRFGLSGHPGMNTAGVAYVHHGGYESCAEPRETWGYGVPRGATTMHILRYAGSAREAREMELGYPVGDTGRILGTASGFYMDDGYAYVLEDRTPGRPIVREQTQGRNGERYDFLYATNNLLSPELGDAFCPPAGGYSYELEAGWFTLSPEGRGQASPGVITRQMCTASSFGRNRYLHRELVARNGAITPERMLSLFRQGPQFPITGWDRAGSRMPQGQLLDASVGGRHNAFIAYGEASSGRYGGAVGMLAPRNVSTNGPAHGFCYHDETGALWDIRLAASHEDMVDEAHRMAEQDIAHASDLLASHRSAEDVAFLEGLLDRANSELEAGLQAAPGERGTSSDPELACDAFKSRSFTRAQVRARQVINAFKSV